MPANPLNEEQLQDAERLKTCFEAWQKPRKKLGLPSSQGYVAKKLGFGQSALSQYLCGKIPLNIRVLVKFSKLMDIASEQISPTLTKNMLNLVRQADIGEVEDYVRSSNSCAIKLDQWVKAARQYAQLSQEVLGSRLGCTKANVSCWEKGKHTPSGEQLLKISLVTNYPLPPGVGGDSTVEALPISPREKRLLKLFAFLPEKEQEELLFLLEEKKHHYDKLWEELSKMRKNLA